LSFENQYLKVQRTVYIYSNRLLKNTGGTAYRNLGGNGLNPVRILRYALPYPSINNLTTNIPEHSTSIFAYPFTFFCLLLYFNTYLLNKNADASEL